MDAQIEPRQRSCQLLCESSQWLACRELSARLIAVGPQSGPRRRAQDRDVGARLHDQLFERQIRVAAGEFTVGGKVSTRIACVNARSPVRRSRSVRRTGGCRSSRCATARGCTVPVRRDAASGTSSRRSAPGTRSAAGLPFRRDGRHRGLPRDPCGSILPSPDAETCGFGVVSRGAAADRYDDGSSIRSMLAAIEFHGQPGLVDAGGLGDEDARHMGALTR